MTRAPLLKSIRLLHRYLGLFFAPTILFFAITGSLQMFGLHETRRGSSYVPLPILVHLSQLHKKGTLYVPSRKMPLAVPAKADGPKPDSQKLVAPTPLATNPAVLVPDPIPMKVFFAAAALALVISTCTGLLLSWKYARRKALVVGTLLAGFACPLLLLLL